MPSRSSLVAGVDVAVFIAIVVVVVVVPDTDTGNDADVDAVRSFSRRRKRSLRKRRRPRFFDDDHCDENGNSQLISCDRRERIGRDLRWTTSDEDSYIREDETDSFGFVSKTLGTISSEETSYEPGTMALRVRKGKRAER